jgi:hypothetical protein
MSNVLKGINFFPVPQDLVKAGTLKRLRGGALKLYLLLLYEAQRISQPCIEFSNREFGENIGLSPTTLRVARVQLWEEGLIDTGEESGKPTLYVLLNPATRTPCSELPEKYRDRYARLPERSIRILQRAHRAGESAAAPLAWNDLAKRD